MKIFTIFERTIQHNYATFRIVPSVSIVVDTQSADYIVHGVGGDTEIVLYFEWLVWVFGITFFIKNKNAIEL